MKYTAPMPATTHTPNLHFKPWRVLSVESPHPTSACGCGTACTSCPAASIFPLGYNKRKQRPKHISSLPASSWQHTPRDCTEGRHLHQTVQLGNWRVSACAARQAEGTAPPKATAKCTEARWGLSLQLCPYIPRKHTVSPSARRWGCPAVKCKGRQERKLPYSENLPLPDSGARRTGSHGLAGGAAGGTDASSAGVGPGLREIEKSGRR